MSDVEYILDFAAHLGRRMLESGATLERVNDTMNRICRSYALTDISIFSLNSIIQIGARTSGGESAFCQVAVSGMNIHLERLSSLNRLSRRVCRETPAPSKLEMMLEETQRTAEYPTWAIILGRLFAMGCMCVLFGGTAGDILASDIIIFFLIFLIDALNAAKLNHIVVNMICMLFAGSAGLLLYGLGVGTQYFVIIITCSMMLVPGIPLVNAARNLLCGNEMNGILELLKAVIETLAIVLGLVAAIALFGGGITWQF